MIRRQTKLLYLILITVLLAACGSDAQKEESARQTETTSSTSHERTPPVEELPPPRSAPERTMLDLVAAFAGATIVLRTVEDETTSLAAAEELDPIMKNIRELVAAAESYSPEGRAEVNPLFSDRLTDETEAFNRELGRILQTPGAAPPLYEVIQAIPPTEPSHDHN